jgi:hypothetical protein
MSCYQGSICFEMMKGVPAGAATLLAGIIVSIIAWRQFKVAQAKLKLDLFERRYKIFEQVWTIASTTVRYGARYPGFGNVGLATPFNNFRPEAAFLFGKRMEAYIDELAHNWSELHGLEGEKDRPDDPNRLKNIARQSELEEYFFAQANMGVRLWFAPFLNFERWK